MREAPIKKMLLVVPGTLLLLCPALGCRQQAYTEVYAQRMAGEIRALEDRIYEYDAEYQILERENLRLLSLQSENQQLKAQLNSSRKPSSSPSPQSGNRPQYIVPLEPATIEPTSPYHFPIPTSEPRRIAPGQERSPQNSEPQELTIPDERSARLPTATWPSQSKVPELITRLRQRSNSQPNDASSTSQPRSLLPRDNSKALINDPSDTNRNPKPTPARSKSGLPVGVEIEDLELKVTAPKFEKSQTSNRRSLPRNELPDGTDAQSLAQAQIEIPGLNEVQLASAESLSRPSESDNHVVEIAFHPVLTRGYDADDNQTDDGIYLLLQPRTASGKFQPEPASMTILALDPARSGEAARIGRWRFSRKEIESRIQPIGNSQGIHLPLKWQNGDPKLNRIVVSVTYEMDDSRKLVNHREITLNHESTTSAAWMPITSVR